MDNQQRHGVVKYATTKAKHRYYPHSGIPERHHRIQANAYVVGYCEAYDDMELNKAAKQTQIDINRQCFVSDDDGHWFLIPDNLREHFKEWLMYWDVELKSSGQEVWVGVDFNTYKLDGGIEQYSFLSPEEK